MTLFNRNDDGTWRSEREIRAAQARFVLATLLAIMAFAYLFNAVSDGLVLRELVNFLDLFVTALENMASAIGA